MTGIPVTGNHVNVAGLHPRFRQRLEAFFADPRIKGKVAVVSGVRTYEQQKYLYRKYKSGRGNLAANPDRRLSSGFQGSYHMGRVLMATDMRLTSVSSRRVRSPPVP